MPELDPQQLGRLGCYRLLIGAVVPRPIAWVSTCDPAGAGNLAPFSFFNGVTAWPPTVMVAISHREPEKDTLLNLRATGEAVVHLVPPGWEEAANATSAEQPHGVDEAQLAGLAQVASTVVAPRRLAAALVALECRLVREIPVGDPPTALCLLEVVRAHVDAAIANGDGLPDPARLRAPARLGGTSWLGAGDWTVRELPRPRPGQP